METILNELTARTDIENLVYTIRGQQVILDSDMANLFQVEPRIINQQMKRNIDRFPEDFLLPIERQ